MKLLTALIASSIFISSAQISFAADQSSNNPADKSTDNSAASQSTATPTGSAGGSPANAPISEQSKTQDVAPLSTKDASSAAPKSPDSATATTSGTKWRPGVELEIGTDAKDLVPTDDVELAKKQVAAYPDSPEASFILAVALTRTSRVEEALKEVRRARKLAEQNGGSAYFDKMISTYEDMLKNYPNENRVRYGLAWAYYMKAYLLANYSKKVAAWKAANGDPAQVLAAKAKADAAAAAAGKADTAKTANTKTAAENAKALEQAKTQLSTAVKPGNKGLDLNNILNTVGSLAQGNTSSLPKIPSVTDNVDPADLPQIKKFYEQGLQKLDELLAQKPDDVWAIVYRAHLRAEYSGNLEEAMATWSQCREKFPNNPAAYFFLGEGYLKQGNLKESLNNVSRAVALRAMGY